MGGCAENGGDSKVQVREICGRRSVIQSGLIRKVELAPSFIPILQRYVPLTTPVGTSCFDWMLDVHGALSASQNWLNKASLATALRSVLCLPVPPANCQEGCRRRRHRDKNMTTDKAPRVVNTPGDRRSSFCEFVRSSKYYRRS
jgi:hypothetical protein